MDKIQIRNFCIIAHIDHGKSTLADRLLELTGTVDKRQMKDQILDKMDLEQERGITIKLASVRMSYHQKFTNSRLPIHNNLPVNISQTKIRSGKPENKKLLANENRQMKNDSIEYQLNLIDTPGHVDFSYEVSRSLNAVEGAILVVDTSQGVQAQTLSNIYLALDANLTIIPVLNKIDLPAADVPRVTDEVIKLLGCKKEDILLISAKTGEGVDKVLERVVSDVPPPSGTAEAPTRALIFDSYYDDYRGVVLYTRIVDGSVKKDQAVKMIGSGAEGLALEVGSLTPDMKPSPELKTGEIGYIVTNLKSTQAGRVGDTVTTLKKGHRGTTLGDSARKSRSAEQGVDTLQRVSTGGSDTAMSQESGQSGELRSSAGHDGVVPLPGYKEIHPFVYAGFFPTSSEDFQALKEAVEKLSLSDSSLRYDPENSPVLGFGLRLGFLGLLHMDIVRERLTREYDLDLIVTNPSTDYLVKLTSGDEVDIKSAADLPDISTVAEIREPWIKGEIVTPVSYVGSVLQLIVGARGKQKKLDYVDARLAVIDFEAPLANLITDFYDQLKSVTSGYGSFSYELDDYRAGDLERVDFYVAGEKVDALSIIVHRTEAERVGRRAVEKLKEAIPRQQFKVSLQAGVGGKFIAREDISAFRKDVTTGLYGGDVSRKKKVLAKQKKGKARMKRFGKVDIPAEAFSVLLKRD